jgi:hypothetical protein
MVFVAFPVVVLAEKKLDATPIALDGIGVGPGLRINELDAVVHSAMRVTLRPKMAVCNPGMLMT